MIGGCTGIPGRQFGRFDNVYLALFTEGIASAVEAGLRIMKGALAANNLIKVGKLRGACAHRAVCFGSGSCQVCLLAQEED